MIQASQAVHLEVYRMEVLARIRIVEGSRFCNEIVIPEERIGVTRFQVAELKVNVNSKTSECVALTAYKSIFSSDKDKNFHLEMGQKALVHSDGHIILILDELDGEVRILDILSV